MSDSHFSVDDLNEKLNRMEKRLKLTTLFGAIVFFVLMLSVFFNNLFLHSGSTVVAERFVLIDQSGNERGLWEVNKDNDEVLFQLKSQYDALRVTIHASNDNSGIKLQSSRNPNILLSANAMNGSQITMKGLRLPENKDKTHDDNILNEEAQLYTGYPILSLHTGYHSFMYLRNGKKSELHLTAGRGENNIGKGPKLTFKKPSNVERMSIGRSTANGEKWEIRFNDINGQPVHIISPSGKNQKQ